MRISLGLSIALLFAAASAARADHGKGAVGGRTIPPRTLHQGDAGLEMGLKYQSSQPLSDDRIIDETMKDHDIHSTDWLLEFALGVSYGVTDQLTVSFSLPFSIVSGFRGGELNETPPPDVLISEAGRISGLGDATLLFKYGLAVDPVELAVLAGVKLPTGRTNEETDDGELLEPDHQPGSGSWDALVGVAAGKQFERWMFSASVLARITTEGRHDFKPGDTLQVAFRAEYQITELGLFPRLYATLELASDFEAKDEVDGVKNGDTGGVILSIIPGVKLRVDAHATVALSVALPLYQGLYGEQHEERFEILFGIGYDF